MNLISMQRIKKEIVVWHYSGYSEKLETVKERFHAMCEKYESDWGYLMNEETGNILDKFTKEEN